MIKHLTTYCWWLAGLLAACAPAPAEQAADSPPNVLLIFTDQQTLHMMSAAGNSLLHTPNMDRLAARGVMFRQAYCTSPVCGPARSSIITGRMPHETGVEWNGDSLRAEVSTVGERLQAAGYRTVWGGKWHLPESYPQRGMEGPKHVRGFELLPLEGPETGNWMLGAETDPLLTKAAVEFITTYEQDQPLFLAVSYHNPHDICFYARKDGWVSEKDSLLEIRYYGFEYQLPEVVGTHPAAFESLPPLPENHEIIAQEAAFVQEKRLHHQEYGVETMLANQEFDSLTWQGYVHAYHRLTEMVDVEIGKVLDALEGSGMADNTLIIFTSDHGDGAAAHQWAAKLNLYQESSMVPMLVSWPGQIPQGMIDATHLVSQIDIVPTIYDYVGVELTEELTGNSVRAIIEAPQGAPWRDHLVVELADFKPDPHRKGRMLRTQRYKYNVYSTGERPEQLFDLENDPGEMQNLALDPAYEEVLQQHRQLLRDWQARTRDTVAF